MGDIKAGGPAVKPTVQRFVGEVAKADQDGKLSTQEEKALRDAFKAMTPQDRQAALAMARESGHAALAAHLEPSSAPKPVVNAHVRNVIGENLKGLGVPEAQRERILDRFEKLDPDTVLREYKNLDASLRPGKMLKMESARTAALERFESHLGRLVDGVPFNKDAAAAKSAADAKARTEGPKPDPSVGKGELDQARNRERLEAQQRLVQTGNTTAVVLGGHIGPDVGEMQEPRLVMERAAAIDQQQSAVKSDRPNQPTQVALENRSMEDVRKNLDQVAAERARKGEPAEGFAREVFLVGHGQPGAWLPNKGVGGPAMDADALSKQTTGALSRAMADGGTVTLSGCDMGQGEEGDRLMREVGRIFFGDGKSGYIQGGTVTTNDPMNPLQVKVRKWKDDFPGA